MRLSGLSTLAAVVFVLLAALGMVEGRPLLVGVLWACQVALAGSWLAVLGVPARTRGTAVAAGAALIADLILAIHRPASVGPIVGVVGGALVAAVLGQLLSSSRERVTDVLAAQTSAVLLACGPATLLALGVSHNGREGAKNALIALAAGLAVGWLVSLVAKRPAVLGGNPLTQIVAIPAVAVAVGAALQGSHGAVLGLVAGVAGCLAVLVARVALGRAARPLSALLPLATASPVLYVVGRVLLG